MPSFNGYDGWSCWGRRYNETGEDDDQGENSIWFAWGPSGALLGPYASRAACVAALIADVEGEKKKAKARHLDGQRRGAEGRRGGQECVRSCRSRGSRQNENKKKQ